MANKNEAEDFSLYDAQVLRLPDLQRRCGAKVQFCRSRPDGAAKQEEGLDHGEALSRHQREGEGQQRREQ